MPDKGIEWLCGALRAAARREPIAVGLHLHLVTTAATDVVPASQSDRTAAA